VFRDQIVAALNTTPRDESWSWEERTNDAIAVLLAEVRITNTAAETFMKWNIGDDRSNSATPGLNLLMAVGQGLFGNWGGAAARRGEGCICSEKTVRRISSVP
jgi:hypothetical protein